MGITDTVTVPISIIKVPNGLPDSKISVAYTTCRYTFPKLITTFRSSRGSAQKTRATTPRDAQWTRPTSYKKEIRETGGMLIRP